MNNIGGLKHKMAWVRYIVWYRLCISNNTYSRKTRLVIKIRLIVFEDWIQNIRVQLYHCKLSLIVMIHTCSINKKKKTECMGVVKCLRKIALYREIISHDLFNMIILLLWKLLKKCKIWNIKVHITKRVLIWFWRENNKCSVK